MYRKLVLVPVLVTIAVALAVAYRPLPAEPAARLPALAMDLGRFTPSCTGAVSCFFVNSLLPWLIALGLIRATAFNPGRRPPLAVAALKYLAGAASAALAVMLLYGEALRMGAGAYVLATQTDKGPLTILAASQAPHGLLQLLALSLLLAAPLFWLVRGAQVRGLGRATFEAWVEVRRLALPSLVLMIAAAVAEVYVTPHTVAWLLH